MREWLNQRGRDGRETRGKIKNVLPPKVLYEKQDEGFLSARSCHYDAAVYTRPVSAEEERIIVYGSATFTRVRHNTVII